MCILSPKAFFEVSMATIVQSLNLRLGFIRLWLVFSVPWVGYAAWKLLDASQRRTSAQSTLDNACGAETLGEGVPPLPPGFCLEGPNLDALRSTIRQASDDITTAVILGALPFLFFAAVEVLLAVGKWVFAGFSEAPVEPATNDESDGPWGKSPK